MSEDNNLKETTLEEALADELASQPDVLDPIATADDIQRKFKKAQTRNTAIIISIVLLFVGGAFTYKWYLDSQLDYIGGNELAIARTGTATTGSPWRSDSFISQLTWATLFETDTTFTEVNSFLAEKLDESADGLTYTITLKDDLKWSDGTPLTVDDVVWSIEAFLLNTSTSTFITTAFNYITGVEEWQEIGHDNWLNSGSASLAGLSSSGNTITIKLDNPYSSFSLALTQFVIYPKHCFTDYDPILIVNNATDYYVEFMQMPVCSGMYKVESINENEDMFLVKNEYYCREFSDIESIVMYTDYQNVNLGYYSSNNLIEMTSYRAMTGFEEYYTEAEWYRYLVVNLNAGYEQPEMVPELDEDGNEVLDADGEVVLVEAVVEYDDTREVNYPMQDIKVRQAISLAIDREALAKDIYLNTATYDFASTGNSSYSSFLSGQNVTEAKRLLEESGYDLSRPLTIGHYHSDSNSIAMLNRVKGYLEEIGFTVNIKRLYNTVEYYETIEYDLFLKAYSASKPVDWYNEYLSTNTSLYNVMGTTQFDDLIISLGASTSVSEYNNILTQVQTLDAETMYKIPLVSTRDAAYIDASRVSVPDDMVFGNVRLRSDLRLDEWYIKKD